MMVNATVHLNDKLYESMPATLIHVRIIELKFNVS